MKPLSDLRNVPVFEAGDGQRYGLVSLDGSGQVVVFRRHLDGVWRGCCEFNDRESAGCWPGDALPEIQAALDEKPHA